MPSRYQNQCWNIVNLNLRNKFQWNLKRNSYIFIQENAFENVICEMAAILLRPQCVKDQSQLLTWSWDPMRYLDTLQALHVEKYWSSGFSAQNHSNVKLWCSFNIYSTHHFKTLVCDVTSCSVSYKSLMAPSHYLNQYWFLISKVQWHSSEGNFKRDTYLSHQSQKLVENCSPKISFKTPRGPMS